MCLCAQTSQEEIANVTVKACNSSIFSQILHGSNHWLIAKDNTGSETIILRYQLDNNLFQRFTNAKSKKYIVSTKVLLNIDNNLDIQGQKSSAYTKI